MSLYFTCVQSCSQYIRTFHIDVRTCPNLTLSCIYPIFWTLLMCMIKSEAKYVPDVKYPALVPRFSPTHPPRHAVRTGYGDVHMLSLHHKLTHAKATPVIHNTYYGKTVRNYPDHLLLVDSDLLLVNTSSRRPWGTSVMTNTVYLLTITA